MQLQFPIKQNPTSSRGGMQHSMILLILAISLVLILTIVPDTTVMSSQSVPVFIMMPLNTVNNDGTLNNPQKLFDYLKRVKQVGTDGIMIDVWWGIIEPSPQQYNFQGYMQLFEMCQQVGLLIEPVLSFHQCGTNVGDECYITLPSWVLKVGADKNQEIFYTDQNGHRDREYISLGADREAIFPSMLNGKYRSPLEMYEQVMIQFNSTFSKFINSGLIDTIEIGLGPAGEMRYPSYQLQDNLWSFPGIGAFQCYDQYMLRDLDQSARNVGHPEWGKGGPNDAGNYNSRPYDTGFFSENTFDNYDSDYGKFFIKWYTGKLIQHGDSILGRARSVFGPSTKLAAKIAGIHWWYYTWSHAAEITAGYYNTIHYNGYIDIAKMFKKYNVEFQFTCLEMKDREQPSDCACGPEELVVLTRDTAFNLNVKYGGENALEILGNYAANQQIARQSIGSNGKVISGFTFLRMSDQLMSNSQFMGSYANLVYTLHNL